MRKHAILMLAHKNLNLVQEIINALDSELFDFYIHIDKKCKENKKLSSKESKIYVESKYEITWGTFSIVEAELDLLNQSIKSNEYYSYFHLISGDDYVCKSQKNIYDFFEKSGKEFVLFSNPEILPSDKNRILYKHIMLGKLRTSKSRFINKFRFIIDDIGVKFQTLTKKTKKLYFKNYQKGSQWFSITRDFAVFIDENKDLIYKQFGDTLIPDELFVQTLLINSKFYNNSNLKNNYNSCVQNSRLIDWDRGKPYVFREQDIDEILNSSCCFVRKVSLDDDLVIKLKSKLLREEGAYEKTK